MKKVLLFIAGLIIAGAIAGYFLLNEKRPVGSDHEAADRMAKNMMAAINDSAWQATGAVSWTFMKSHHHLWDKDRHLARVAWKNNEVLLDINSITGTARKNGEILSGKKADKLVKTAWKFWANDSFWLNPVSKAFDDGTTRSLATLKDGRTGLMVSYSTGGVTPGDAYVWMLDESYRPTSWKMWVSIIPVGGLEVPWSTWLTTETGAEICNLHESVMNLELTDVHTAFNLKDLTGDTDPFDELF